jgi:hypothetical protein
MNQGDLDVSLLFEIMRRLGEFRGNRPGYPLHTGELMTLVPPAVGTGLVALNHLDRHVDFLRDTGLLSTGQAGAYRTLKLTGRGQRFVQPELAEFGEPAMLPRVVKSLEDKIQVLTYPQEEKDGMLYTNSVLLRQSTGEARTRSCSRHRRVR